jgi:hypothetical protein
MVWTSETRPICGAGSLDSLTRAALQKLARSFDKAKKSCTHTRRHRRNTPYPPSICKNIERKGLQICIS